MLFAVCSEKKLGDARQVFEDHCYSRRKGEAWDKDSKDDICVDIDTKKIDECSKSSANKKSDKTNLMKVNITNYY